MGWDTAQYHKTDTETFPYCPPLLRSDDVASTGPYVCLGVHEETEGCEEA